MSGLAVAAVALTGVSLALGMGFSALARNIAPRFGLVDKPGGRKAHRAPTPMGGGVAIWATTGLMLLGGAIALAFFRAELPPELTRHAAGLWSRGPELAAIFGLATVIMVMGLARRPGRAGLEAPADRPGRAGDDPRRVGRPRHAVLAAESPRDLRRDHRALDRRPDERVQLPRQHGRPGRGRRADRGAALRGGAGDRRQPVRAGRPARSGRGAGGLPRLQLLSGHAFHGGRGQ